MVATPRQAKEGGEFVFDFLFTFILSVVAGIVAYYICKWFDR